MTRASVLVFPNRADTRNTFSFEHAMAHRNVMAVMGPLNQWSVMPYFIDPEQYKPLPAGKWALNHQQAHDDFNKYLPADPSAATAGIPTAQILIDSDFSRRGPRSWWTFANHTEHFIAGTAIHPLPLTQPSLPWWLQPPRQVQTYW